LATRIARHLVAAGELLDTDPDEALRHARYAKRKASRIPVVRETLGSAAYYVGQWSEALTELRAARRMTRSNNYVAVIADAERGLGRPQRALDLVAETDTDALSKEVAVELRIVAAGARRDLGQTEAAVSRCRDRTCSRRVTNRGVRGCSMRMPTTLRPLGARLRRCVGSCGPREWTMDSRPTPRN